MGAASSRDAQGCRKVRSCSGSRPGKQPVKDRFFGSACLRSRQVFSDEENDGNSSRIEIKSCTVELGQSSLTHQESAKAPQNLWLSSNFSRLAEDNRENMSEPQMELPSDCSFSIPCGEEVNHADRVVGVSSSIDCGPNKETVTGATSSASAVVSDTNSTGGVGHYSQTNIVLSDILGVGYSQRHSQEPLETTARFRRNRIVDRLHDRVVHRSLLFEERSEAITTTDESQGYIHQDSRMQLISGAENVSSTDENVETATSSMTRHLSRMSRSSENSHNPDSETTTSWDNNSLDYRLAFLERRRRIRSQVRALQRLSMRFESLSGHERSCILSGHHRTGLCPCRTMTHSISYGNVMTTRASVSRIVMLAEALFEVLDEIHQQAVVLASRSSVSSIGAVPAPKEVVDCMPVKLFNGVQKCPSDEAAQCYICLVEYEEGDCMRILPCCHEFHQACVDKWLKEVHRVCPLCRGDVCISELTHVDGLESST